MLNHSARTSEKVSVREAFGRITKHWRPATVARLNGQEVKLCRLLGTFVWHAHDDADELFWVHKGTLRIQFRDGEVELGPGEILVVPRGVEHRPVAAEEVELILFEPAGVVNTGNAPESYLTARST